MVLSLPYAEWYLSRAYAVVSKKNYFSAKHYTILEDYFWGQSLYLFNLQAKNIS